MKKILFILIFLIIALQGAFASYTENILASPKYLVKLKVKLEEFVREKKCHGVQTFYVSKLDIYKDDFGMTMHDVYIYWVDGDMLYYYFGDDHISDSKSNNLRKDVYKTRKEIYGSSFLLTVDEAKEIIQRCKNGNKIIIQLPPKKSRS